MHSVCNNTIRFIKNNTPLVILIIILVCVVIINNKTELKQYLRNVKEHLTVFPMRGINDFATLAKDTKIKIIGLKCSVKSANGTINNYNLAIVPRTNIVERCSLCPKDVSILTPNPLTQQINTFIAPTPVLENVNKSLENHILALVNENPMKRKNSANEVIDYVDINKTYNDLTHCRDNNKIDCINDGKYPSCDQYVINNCPESKIYSTNLGFYLDMVSSSGSDETDVNRNYLLKYAGLNITKSPTSSDAAKPIVGIQSAATLNFPCLFDLPSEADDKYKIMLDTQDLSGDKYKFKMYFVTKKDEKEKKLYIGLSQISSCTKKYNDENKDNLYPEYAFLTLYDGKVHTDATTADKKMIGQLNEITKTLGRINGYTDQH